MVSDLIQILGIEEWHSTDKSFGGLICDSTAAERRRREEGWNDLGLDQLDRNGNVAAAAASRVSSQRG